MKRLNLRLHIVDLFVPLVGIAVIVLVVILLYGIAFAIPDTSYKKGYQQGQQDCINGIYNLDGNDVKGQTFKVK